MNYHSLIVGNNSRAAGIEGYATIFKTTGIRLRRALASVIGILCIGEKFVSSDANITYWPRSTKSMVWLGTCSAQFGQKLTFICALPETPPISRGFYLPLGSVVIAVNTARKETRRRRNLPRIPKLCTSNSSFIVAHLQLRIFFGYSCVGDKVMPSQRHCQVR